MTYELQYWNPHTGWRTFRQSDNEFFLRVLVARLYLRLPVRTLVRVTKAYVPTKYDPKEQ